MKGPNPLEKPLERFGTAVQTPEGRSKILRFLLRSIRIALLLVAIAYLLPLLSLTIGMHWRAEKNIALAFFSYLPAHLWILPAPALLLITLPFSWRLALVYAAVIAAFLFLFMDFQGAPETHRAPEGASRLRILSYNRGQHLNQSLQPFKDKIAPDVIALQEAFGRAPLYERAENYSEFEHTDGIGEFVVLSKYPILEKRLLSFHAWKRDRHIAARFEIDLDGRPVALYVVHMPTLRDILSYYRRGAFIYGLIGVPGTPLGARRAENQRSWDQRIDLARELEEVIASEELPCIVVGDFNMPDHGHIYHLFTKTLTDAHEEAGGGFGYTFPGTTGNPLTLWGPWLRLDYAFCSDDWKTVNFVTEKERTSQHRAIAAEFALKPSP